VRKPLSKKAASSISERLVIYWRLLRCFLLACSLPDNVYHKFVKLETRFFMMQLWIRIATILGALKSQDANHVSLHDQTIDKKLMVSTLLNIIAIYTFTCMLLSILYRYISVGVPNLFTRAMWPTHPLPLLCLPRHCAHNASSR